MAINHHPTAALTDASLLRMPNGDIAPLAGATAQAWVGLGANLGDRGQVMQQALQRLQAHSAVTVHAVSSLYASKPVDSGRVEVATSATEPTNRAKARRRCRAAESA